MFSKKFKQNETELSKEYGFFHREKVGFYEIFDGERIDCKIVSEDPKEFLRVLLNYPFACVMYQKGFVPIHGSAVYLNGKTILICGLPGVGKSSLAAAFTKFGAKIISEDTLVIDISAEDPLILPSYPWIKLSKEVNNSIGFSRVKGQKFEHEASNREGFILKEEFLDKEKKIDFIVYPEWSLKENIYELDVSEALGELMSYNLSNFPFTGSKEKEIFISSMEIISKTRSFKLQLTKDTSNILSICELIAEKLEIKA